MAKKTSIVDKISDTVHEMVEGASAAPAQVLRPDPEGVAGTANEQVYIPEAKNGSTAALRKTKRGPTPFRGNKRVAKARAAKKTTTTKKAAPTKAAKKAPKKAPKNTAQSSLKKAAKKGKKSKR